MDANWTTFYDRPLSVADRTATLGEHGPFLAAAAQPGTTRLLEVGIGTGLMSHFLASIGWEVVGVDNDEALVDKLSPTCHDSLSYRVADAFHLADEFPAGAFDVAFSQGFFEHFADDEIRELVEQQLKVAKRVVFSVPSCFYPQQDFGNERLLTQEQWGVILRRCRPRVSCYGHHFFGYKLQFWRIRLNDVWRPLHILVEIDASIALAV